MTAGEFDCTRDGAETLNMLGRFSCLDSDRIRGSAVPRIHGLIDFKQFRGAEVLRGAWHVLSPFFFGKRPKVVGENREISCLTIEKSWKCKL